MAAFDGGYWESVDLAVPESGRSADPASPFYIHPAITEIARRHPTAIEVLRRESEIAEWHHEQKLGRIRREISDRRRTLRSAGYILCGGLAPVAMLAQHSLLYVAIAVVFGLQLLSKAFEPIEFSDDSPAPEPLSIVPYTKRENACIAVRERPTFFTALCGCPGCGTVDVHKVCEIDPPVRTPAGAVVVRSCGVCLREWTQN